MRKAKMNILTMSALALAIATAGGCVSAKVNPNDEPAAAAPAPAPAPAKTMDEAITSYTVVKNDNLWSISEMDKIYGTPYNWPLIYKSNASQINDADLIFPGQVLDIPRNSSQGDIDAAVMHAKTRGAWSVGPTEASDTAFLGG